MQIKSQMVEEIKTPKSVSSVQWPVNSNTHWIVNQLQTPMQYNKRDLKIGI